MLHFSTLLFAFSVAGSVTAAPTKLDKRIAQVIADSTTKWQAACEAANGGSQCNQIAVNAFGTLLAGAGNCDQQNNADIMMDLSKKLASQDMISLTQIFGQQPRNSPNSLSVPYCQQAPRNAELNGIFQCQFQGTNPNLFVGNLKPGAAGTIPFGQKAAVNPPGSCPANPSGPVPAGQQLDDLVQSPGVIGGSSAGNSTASSSVSNSSTQATSSSAASAANTSPAPTPRAAANSSASGSGSDFKAQNGKEAQALNQKFQSLTPDSSCTDGEQACVNGQFAQCSGGKFALTPCSGGLTCTALPLVNKAGTSVTCDSQADSSARITQALGSRAAPASVQQQNGKDAQALNQQFQSLTPDSSCTDGEQACVNGQFAQCSGGKFALTPCSGGLTCSALPLVDKAGTSVTCDSQADSSARIAQALGSRK